MFIKSFAIGLIFLPLITACAQPTTISPKATPAEIAAEEQTQKDRYRDARMKGLVHGVGSSKPAAPRLQSVASRIAPASAGLCRELGFKDPTECAYDIHLTQETGEGALNATADGKTIRISSSMVRLTENNDQLAFIIAHESSHNILKHSDAGMQNVAFGAIAGLLIDAAAASEGYNTGGEFSKTGAVSGRLAYSPSFEQEADYTGLYVMARAGYDYHKAPDFWRRASLENPESIYLSTTHPSNSERFVVMQKTIAEIDDKKRKGLPLIPQFKRAM